MKAEDLVKKLKKFIKEEVRRTVSDEVNKSMSRMLAEVIKNNNTSLNSGRLPQNNNNSYDEETPRPQKKYTSDTRLNEALNNTISDLRERESSAGIEEDHNLSDLFGKIGDNEEAINYSEPEIDSSSKIGMLKSIVGKGPVTQQSSVLDNVHHNPLKNVMKKDFRSLIKKMDNIKGSGGSYFSMGSIPMASNEELNQIPIE